MKKPKHDCIPFPGVTTVETKFNISKLEPRQGHWDFEKVQMLSQNINFNNMIESVA